jgi:hypothetical protein
MPFSMLLAEYLGMVNKYNQRCDPLRLELILL